jgi:hypothetical protein
METTPRVLYNTVTGHVTDGNGRPLADLRVEIYAVMMRDWQPLGNTLTGRDGSYLVKWQYPKADKQEQKPVAIGLRVFTADREEELYESPVNEIRYNAGKRELVDMVIAEPVRRQIIEFEWLERTLFSKVGQVPIAELGETAENQDISFLTKEIGIGADKIEHLVLAYRLNNASKIDAPFFYALFRKKTLLHNSFSSNLSGRAVIGIDADVQLLMYDAALADSKLIENDIREAVGEKLVPESVLKGLSRNLENLSQYRKRAEEYYKTEHPKRAANLITDFFAEGKITEIQKLFVEHKNDINTFLSKLTEPAFYEPKQEDNGTKLRTSPGKLFGFGSEIIPKIAKARGIEKPEDLRKLARLNKADWVREITRAQPDLKDKKLIDTYASAIVRKMENEYPTLAFAAQLERAPKQVLDHQKEMVSFFAGK